MAATRFLFNKLIGLFLKLAIVVLLFFPCSGSEMPCKVDDCCNS